jgi:hypothetical protein
LKVTANRRRLAPKSKRVISDGFVVAAFKLVSITCGARLFDRAWPGLPG